MDLAFHFRRLFTAALLLVLAACGGGGGGGDGSAGRLFAPEVALQGSWQRTISFDGQASASTVVAGADVPSESEAGAFTVATVAQLEAARFPDKTVTVTTNSLRATDPDTDFTVVVNSLTVTNFTGCGSCAVGTVVSFTITANLTESGRLDGVNVAATTRNSVLTVRYQRIS